MARSLRFMWPRAESGIYREPQRLVDLGYATVEEVAAGPRRTKAVYSATPKGRRALQRWLQTPSAPPQFESESLVKFFFVDRGTRDDAHRLMAELATHAELLRQTFRAITASYARSPGPFPERLHIGALIGRFVFDYAQALAEWTRWADEHVAEWPVTGPAAARLGEKVQRESERLARLPTDG